jgi:hypothetical protein
MWPRPGWMSLALTMTPEQAHATTAQYGTWISYSGTARIVLAIILVAAAGGVAYTGTRLPKPVRPAKPGETARTFIFLTWLFAITAFLACASQYIHQMRREYLFHPRLVLQP